jgi:hypothetical protein
VNEGSSLFSKLALERFQYPGCSIGVEQKKGDCTQMLVWASVEKECTCNLAQGFFSTILSNNLNHRYLLFNLLISLPKRLTFLRLQLGDGTLLLSQQH